MERRQLGSRATECVRDLDETARVRARVHVGAGRGDVRRLALPELRGGPRLDQVVDAGAATADRLFGRLGELEARDRAEQRARLRLHLLRVEQVARVLEGDAELERVALGPRLELGEELRDVHDRHVEAGVLEVRAAAGGVDDEALDALLAEERLDPSRPLMTLGPTARVQVERAAAGLTRRGDD